MNTDHGGLALQLEQLQREATRHGFDDLAERAGQRRRDYDASTFVMVVGEGKFGKSSLINALLGKSIAPVSRLPKTWKVDVYESATGPEQAWLHWRSRPDEPEAVPLERAHEICQQEEARAEDAAAANVQWKTDLLQARWQSAVAWPPPRVALVDTPGFAQLRADSDITDTHLYGSQGFVVLGADAFQHYFYRSDIVLWCLKATKLQDRDTLETLSRVSAGDRPMIAVLTFIDQVPPERWPETLAAAEDIYGRWFSTFLPCAAGSSLPIGTAHAVQIRDLVQRHLTDGPLAVKKRATTEFYAVERLTLLQTLDSLMGCVQRNRLRKQELIGSIRLRVAAALEAVRNQAQSAIAASQQSGASRVNQIGTSTNWSRDAFAEVFRRQGIAVAALNDDVRRIASSALSRLTADLVVQLADASWEGLEIGNSTPTSISLRSCSQFASLPHFELTGLGHISVPKPTMPTPPPAATAAIAKAGMRFPPLLIAAAAVGAVGYAAHKAHEYATRQRDCVASAKKALDQFAITATKALEREIRRLNDVILGSVLDSIGSAFAAHHGRTECQLAAMALEVDHTISILEGWGPHRKTVPMPSALFPDDPAALPRSGFFSSFASDAPDLVSRWDDAALHDARGHLLRLLRDSRSEAKGPLSSAAITTAADSHARKAREHIDREAATVGLCQRAAIDGAALVVASGLSEFLADLLSAALRALLPAAQAASPARPIQMQDLWDRALRSAVAAMTSPADPRATEALPTAMFPSTNIFAFRVRKTHSRRADEFVTAVHRAYAHRLAACWERDLLALAPPTDLRPQCDGAHGVEPPPTMQDAV